MIAQPAAEESPAPRAAPPPAPPALKPLRTLPGPSGLPVAGSFFDLRSDPLGFFERCARTHGNLYRLRIFQPFLVINEPRLVRDVFIRQSHAIRRSRRAHEIRVALGEGVVVTDGDKWKLLRETLYGAFHPQRFLDDEERITSLMERRAASWSDRPTIPLRAQIARLTLAISAYTFFDFDLDEHEEEISRALDVINDEFAQVIKSWAPVPLYVPGLGRMRVRRSYRTLAAVARQIIRHAEEKPSQITDWILALQRMCSEQGLPDQIVLDQVIFLLMASYDTTAVAITYTIWLLSRHPEVQEDLASQLAAEDDAARRANLVRPVFEEAMRLYPPVWGLGREAGTDIEVGEYLVPAGTQIMTLPYIIHRDPELFPEPDLFRPERFLDRRTLNRTAFFPFSMGPQACMGAQFATTESLMIVGRLLTQFQFRDRGEHDPGSVLGITLRPQRDFRVEVRRRPSPRLARPAPSVAAG